MLVKVTHEPRELDFVIIPAISYTRQSTDVAARIDAAHAAVPPSTSGRPDYRLAEELELERSKVKCAKFGEMNQRDFEKCWICESALPDAR